MAPASQQSAPSTESSVIMRAALAPALATNAPHADHRTLSSFGSPVPEGALESARCVRVRRTGEEDSDSGRDHRHGDRAQRQPGVKVLVVARVREAE
jgi:hypothetical protein